MATTPTARSLALLREQGYTAQVVERWNPHARIRQDLFGCIDILAVASGVVLGVQATSGSNTAARLAKAKTLPGLRAWLESGARFEVWGWRKAGPRGGRKVWSCRRVVLTLADAEGVQIVRAEGDLIPPPLA